MLSVGRSMAMIPDYSKAKIAALRIMELNKRQSKIDPNDESGLILVSLFNLYIFRLKPTTFFFRIMLSVILNDVHFRYPSRPTVRILRDFSLKCSNGNTTALVGPSGGGKSTIIALLQRFYNLSNGKILLDGNDIKILNIRWLRSIMGLVQQEPVLFNISVRDNIAYGDNSREITQDEV
jgi:ABC-type multidrug transport system fused ATPase/permease subunit